MVKILSPLENDLDAKSPQPRSDVIWIPTLPVQRSFASFISSSMDSKVEGTKVEWNLHAHVPVQALAMGVFANNSVRVAVVSLRLGVVLGPAYLHRE